MQLLKKKFIVVTTLTLLIVGVIISLYWYNHPTHYKYNDRFIIGSSMHAITSRYGEFDIIFNSEPNRKGKIAGAGYLVANERVGFLGTTPEQFYMITFNDEGIAISVCIDGGWGG